MEGDISTPAPATIPNSPPANDNIGITTPPPAPVGAVGGCSETANTKAGKRTKVTDEETDGDDGLGSGMPLAREQLHPLQNPVILTHLFERCPPGLLAQCRLVCKQWMGLSLTSWRATAQLLLYHYPKGVKHMTFQQYLEFMDSPESKCGRKPHRKMKLMSWSWSNDISKEPIPSFWSRVGDHLTSLELSNCVFLGVEDLRGIIFRSCPKLKRLCLHSCVFMQSALVEDFRELKYVEPTFGEQTNLRSLSLKILVSGVSFNPPPIHWLEMFSHFQSLTTLKVSLNRKPFTPVTESVTEEILKAIETIRQRDERKLRLENLDLDPPLKFVADRGPHPDLSLLEKLELPLESLEIEVENNDRPRNPTLEGLLDRHRHTLSRITVSRDRNPGYSFSRFPFSWWFPCNVVLEKLEELRIHMICTSMEFLKNTPKLKKLQFLNAPGYGYSKDEETRIFLEPVDNDSGFVGVKLLQLTEFRMDYRVTMVDIISLARMMPNVRKLTMSLNDKLFSTVCRCWQDLKELEVLGEDLTDKGVTGLAGDGYGGRGNRAAFSDITDLQGLERFKFWSPNLTDFSVFQGFLKLPGFKALEICEGVLPLGEFARKALQDRNIHFQGKYECEWGGYGEGDYRNDEFVDEDDRDF